MMMKLFTNDPELLAIGSSYIRIMGITYICWGMTEVYLAVLRSIGRVTTSMAMNMLAFGLNILWWTFAWNTMFSWMLIIITWTNSNSIYPYLTWVNNDILMCWLPYTGTILTGNIWIYDTNGILINGASFSWDSLYITGMDGLDFILSNDQIHIQ